MMLQRQRKEIHGCLSCGMFGTCFMVDILTSNEADNMIPYGNGNQGRTGKRVVFYFSGPRFSKFRKKELFRRGNNQPDVC